MKIVLAGLILVYALLAHGALLGLNPDWRVYAAWLLPALMVLVAIRNRSVLFLLTALALGGLVLLLARAEATALLLMLPPPLIHGFLALVFGASLRAGHIPLIERFIRLVHGPERPPDAVMSAYARKVTWAWTLLFMAIAAIELALLVLLQPDGLLAQIGWPMPAIPLHSGHFAWFANVGSFLAMALLMGIEWQIRRRRFRDQPYRNLFDFLQRVMRVGPEIARQWRQKS